jgi:catechol 2,3-dioxygenase-like lactoylglutathione lyase family enzyme
VSPPPSQTNDSRSSVLRGVDRLIIRVTNLPAAVRYYRDTLGLELRREAGTFASLAMPSGVEVLLHTDDSLPAEATYLLVEDVRKLHAEAEARSLRFVGPPQRVGRGYRATVKDPFGTVLLLIDRTLAAASPSTPETAAVADALFPGVPVKLAIRRPELIRLYEQADRTADDLPYTPQFEQIHAGYAAVFPEPQPDRAETWRHLLSLRKRGELPRLGAARSSTRGTSQADTRAVELLRRIIDSDFAGKLGRRDRLPYSVDFDRLADRFNEERVGRGDPPLAPHPLWRLVASIAK